MIPDDPDSSCLLPVFGLVVALLTALVTPPIHSAPQPDGGVVDAGSEAP